MFRGERAWTVSDYTIIICFTVPAGGDGFPWLMMVPLSSALRKAPVTVAFDTGGPTPRGRVPVISLACPPPNDGLADNG